MYNRGDKVLFVGGDYKNQFGTYLHHDYDSGYYVPHVKLEDKGFIVKPWDKEIVSLIDREATRERLRKELKMCDEIIHHWYTLVENKE